MSLHFLDFEVFKYDWLVVIYNPVTRVTTEIINNFEKLKNYYDTYKNDIFIGYNIKGYDRWIFSGILQGFDPKKINDFIISGGNGWEFNAKLNRLKFNLFDCKIKQALGLKTLEGFMGSSIQESNVPFDIDRKLTEGEIKEVLKYCRHDVEETIKVFIENKNEFETQLEIIKTFNLPLKYLAKTKPTLSAVVLGAQFQNHDDEWDYIIPNCAKIERYREVIDWYKNPTNKDYNKQLNIDISGVPHVFAWGGLHGAIPQYCKEGFFVLCDVSSYYPSLMIVYNYISRNIKNPKNFIEIYKKRLEYKSLHDSRQKPFKIILNSTYGAMKDRSNPLYDPLMANNVCVGGQILLLDLIEKIEDFFDLLQSNTDGILLKLRAYTLAQAQEEFKKLVDICAEWERRTGMRLEFSKYKKVIQKDVNNYICIKNDGSCKLVGAYVKKLSVLDNDLAIVNQALFNKLVKNISIEDTINNCDEFIKFQKIVKISSKYDYGMHNGKKLQEKYFRVFASNDLKNTSIFKVKKGKNPEKFANVPECCFIYNDEVRNKGVPPELDREWYISLAYDRLRQFTRI